ncbi:hypothetical protein [Gorillibacterium sp. sgz5001074]|uniref:hypothetical protein n=1 Tax=Gorillibacterium sp. sgz5001074 TaxID=3446695 RepID=UPI003F677F2E
MKALVTYMLHNLMKSGRYFMPSVAFIIIVPWIYTIKPNPVLESYGTTSAILFCAAAWFTMQLWGAETERQMELTVLHAGGIRRYVWGRWIMLGVSGVVFSLYSILVPIGMSAFNRSVTAADLLLAAYAHGTAFLLGSLLVWGAELLFRKRSTLLGAVLVGVTASLAAGGLHDLLPAWGSWVVWILPPIYKVMEILSVYGSSDRSGAFFWLEIILPLLYSAAGVIVSTRLFRIPKA